jgi:hypothetical protein
MIDEQLKAALADNGYHHLRDINGVICGLLPMAYTYSLLVGLDQFSYERRYCFESFTEARKALAAWDGKEHVSGPWIKCKGRYQGKPIDQLGPEFLHMDHDHANAR